MSEILCAKWLPDDLSTIGRALRALERAGCSDEEHRFQYEKALQAGLQTAEDYTEVS